MDDKNHGENWFGLEPESSKVEGSTEPKAEETKESQATAYKSRDITFIDRFRDAEGGYYATIQGHKIRDRNQILRLFFLHVIIDLTTNDALKLKQLIYSGRFPVIDQNKNYEGVKISEMAFFDPDNIPPIKGR